MEIACALITNEQKSITDTTQHNYVYTAHYAILGSAKSTLHRISSILLYMYKHTLQISSNKISEST